MNGQPQFQRDAIKRLLNRPEFQYENVARRLGVSNSRLEEWFAGGRMLLPQQFNRLRSIAVPLQGSQRRAREDYAGAAYRRILRKANSEGKSPPVIRVLHVIELLKTAEYIRLQLFPVANDLDNNLSWEKYDPASNRFSDPKFQALNTQMQSVMNQLSRCLKRYKWTPTVVDCAFLGLTCRPIWPRRSAENHWENWAVFWLLDHAAKNSNGNSPSLILRFRHCRECHNWFYAIANHQEHCSERCRKRFHSQSPESKKKRADYMRETYRPQKKVREAQSKNRAKALAASRKKGEA